MDRQDKTSGAVRWEHVLLILACASLVIACILVSNKKHFWNDEFFTYYFVSDPSFTSMLAAFHDRLNNTPLLYFALGWVWDKVFGSAELSLRLFSSLGICAALVLTWITLRRSYGSWPAILGPLAVFGTSSVILDQNAEARMYGLFLALCAGAYLLYDRSCRMERPANWVLWLNAAVHAGILHTHLFGGFFSGAVLISFLLTDRITGRFRPRVYLSVLLSWLSIILYIPSFLIQAEAGDPRSWLPAPVLMDLLDVMNITSSPFFWRPILLLPAALLVLYIIGRWRVRPAGSLRSMKPKLPPDSSHLVFAAVFLVLPVFIWLFSITARPIFLNRYMIPTALGWAILFASVFQRLLPGREGDPLLTNKRKDSAWPTIMFAALVMVPLAIFLVYPLHWARRYPDASILKGSVVLDRPDDLPVVISTSHEFMQFLHYSQDPERYYFILDWEAAVNEYSGTFSPQEFKHMEAWKRNYPHYFGNVVPSEQFLASYSRFLVLDLPDHERKCLLRSTGMRNIWDVLQCPQWVEMRLIQNDAYDVSRLESGDGFSVLLVEKRI
jgi:hypothetical protein